jgi:hypothetical protein
MVFTENCGFGQMLKTTREHCKKLMQVSIDSEINLRSVCSVVFTENCGQFGGFHRELRSVRWFSQSIAVNSVLFADYCSQFGGFFRVLRVPSTNKINH